MPKKSCPSDPKDYQPIALTSRAMKVLERLVLVHPCSQVRSSLDPLQFAHQPRLRMEDEAGCVEWSVRNHVLQSMAKTREMVVVFKLKKTATQPLNILGEDIETVENYKYLGVKANRTEGPTPRMCTGKGMSRLYFPRKLRSFGVCSRMLDIYKSVVAGALFYTAVCWESSTGAGNTNKLNKLIRKAGSVIGCKMDTVGAVVERGMLNKLLSILDNPDHTLHPPPDRQRSSLSNRYRKSFLPSAISLFSSAITL